MTKQYLSLAVPVQKISNIKIVLTTLAKAQDATSLPLFSLFLIHITKSFTFADNTYNTQSFG